MTVYEELEYKVLTCTDDECWPWHRAIDSTGAGSVWLDGKVHRAYVLAYELRHGSVPEGLELDHLCHHPWCWNPNHLKAVSHQENCIRGDRRSGITHCPQGHPYSEENTWRDRRGYRWCRLCGNERNRQQRRKIQASANAAGLTSRQYLAERRATRC